MLLVTPKRVLSYSDGDDDFGNSVMVVWMSGIQHSKHSAGMPYSARQLVGEFVIVMSSPQRAVSTGRGAGHASGGACHTA